MQATRTIIYSESKGDWINEIELFIYGEIMIVRSTQGRYPNLSTALQISYLRDGGAPAATNKDADASARETHASGPLPQA